MELRWGIVGTGRLVAERVAPAMARSSAARLVACVDSDPDRARALAAVHGIDRVYRSFEELVRDPEVDAVYVATPNNMHYPVVLAAAEAGKQVLCQKPMALRPSEAEEMVVACRSAGVILRVGLQLRFLRVLQAMKSIVQSGRLGSLKEVTAQRCGPMDLPTRTPWRRELGAAGGGALVDVGVHTIDFVRWVVGDRVSSVFALAQPPRSSGLPDETAVVVLEFTGGCLATIRSNRDVSLGTNDFQLFGSDGMVVSGPLTSDCPQQLLLRFSGGTEEQRFPADNVYFREIESFAEEVAGRRTLMATGEEGAYLVRITEAIVSSLETHRSVAVHE
jgi:1,5-anhydro-D-fructose reductase (1,5-anhydro-D-mannitol-forming)